MDRVELTASGRGRNEFLIVAVVLLILAAGLLVGGRDIFWQKAPVENLVPVVPPVTSPIIKEKEDDAPSTAILIADDGQTLWISPTAGPPIDLAYLPSGCQVSVHLRPAQLLNHAEGDKIVAALAPIGAKSIDHIESQVGLPLEEMDRLLIGLYADADGNWQATYVIEPVSDHPPHFEDGLGEEGAKFIVSPDGTRQDIGDADNEPPLLRREMEQLVAATDADRHVTILFVPSYVFGQGKSIFSGMAASLRDPLFSFFGDGLQAAALSLHWSDDFFMEFSSIARIDELPQTTAERLLGRVERLPLQLEDWVLDRKFDPHGRRIVARLPGMSRALARYTRAGVEDDRVILRAYLPVEAGHNLLMASELALTQSAGTVAVASNRSDAAESFDVRQRLQRPTTLRFARDTLEAALKMLAEEIGVEIEILGRDLQLEGITKNQAFGLDEQSRPAEEILVEILRRANPDRTAAGPADPRQKLVYIVTVDAISGKEIIQVTTRAATLSRSEKLPPVFVGE